MTIARRDFGRGIFERATAVVECQRLKDFRKGIGFVADCKRACAEGATASAATIE